MSGWVWLVLGVLFGAIEVAHRAFYFVFLAAGALAAAFAAALGGPWAVDLAVFAGVSIGGVGFARRFLVRALGLERPALVSGARGLIGQTGTVTQCVHGPHRPGSVHVRGEDWPAISYDDEEFDPGQVVLVVDLERTRLVVTSNA